MRPITKETAQFLKPLKINKHDRMDVSLDTDQNFICRIFRPSGTYTDSSGVEHARSTRASYDSDILFPSRIPERKKLVGWPTTYQFAANDYSAQLIDIIWPDKQIVFTPEARIIYEYLLLVAKAQDRSAKTVAEYRLRTQLQDVMDTSDYALASGLAPPIFEDNYEYHPELELAPYQKVAMHSSIISPAGYGLFQKQGTGKTPVVIGVINNEAQKYYEKTGKVYRAVVCCPNALRTNWKNEIGRFSTLAGRVVIIEGTDTARRMQFLESLVDDGTSYFVVYIIGYDTLTRTIDYIESIEEITGTPYNLAVGDESHWFKNPKTKRWQAMERLRDCSLKRMPLTGTPMTNTLFDFYTQFEFIEKGLSGFSTFKHFRDFYGVFKKIPSTGDTIMVGYNNVPFIQERLAGNSFQISLQEACPYLPDMVYDVIEVQMSPQQKEIYGQVATYLAAEIENDLAQEGTSKSLVVNNILTKLLRLAQITAGHVTWDAVVDPYTGEELQSRLVDRFDPNPKLEALMELIKDKPPQEKTLIWGCWIFDIKTISARIALEFGPESTICFHGGVPQKSRDELVDRFNGNRKCQFFVGNAAVGGTGLNLLGYPVGKEDEYESNVTHAIYYSQDWSSVKRDQSESRPMRRGTRQNVRVTDLVVPGTVDEQIRTRVMDKIQSAIKIGNIKEILTATLQGNFNALSDI